MNKIKMADQFRLGDLIRKEYTTSGKTDEEFAAYASETLDVLVNGTNLTNARVALGIPSRKERLKAESPATIAERLEATEAAIGKLMRRVDALERLLTPRELKP